MVLEATVRTRRDMNMLKSVVKAVYFSVFGSEEVIQDVNDMLQTIIVF